ncbi:hypothetical protein [Mycobacterium parmense]|uniref:HNH endonuclease n=1 Tax=Mycobacterium parmense TaxID=185642 RepID=A0A7I7YSN7_9MYCO|nr:hypothetical protein MPRM_20110 [Mycobacterium parmense]
MKTFWGWRDQQLPDGTVLWRLSDGSTYVTTPGSAWLFPQLCAPTGPAPRWAAEPTGRCGERTAMMPKRKRTRAQNRAHYIATERRHNRQARQVPERQTATCDFGCSGIVGDDDDPPPF